MASEQTTEAFKPPTPSEVANQFCIVYFRMCLKNPEQLPQLYHPDGHFSHMSTKESDLLHQVTGKDNIRRALQTSAVEVQGELQQTFCHAQESINNSVLIIVGGLFTRAVDNLTMPFVQTFLLVSRDGPLQYFCLNSVFRLLDNLWPIHGALLAPPAAMLTPMESFSSTDKEMGKATSTNPPIPTANTTAIATTSASTSTSTSTTISTLASPSGGVVSSAPVSIKTVESSPSAPDTSSNSPSPPAPTTAAPTTTIATKNNSNNSNNGNSTSNSPKKVDVQAPSEEPAIPKKQVNSSDTTSAVLTTTPIESAVTSSTGTDKASAAAIDHKIAVHIPVAAPAQVVKIPSTYAGIAGIIKSNSEPSAKKEEKPAVEKPKDPKKPASKETAASTTKDGKDAAKVPAAIAASSSSGLKESGKESHRARGVVKSENESRIVFVFGSQKKEDLKKLFSKFGTVTKIDLPDKDKNYSFVEFESEEMARDVVQKGQIQAEDGTTLRVELKGNKSGSPSNSNSGAKKAGESGGVSAKAEASESKEASEHAQAADKVKDNGNREKDNRNRRSGGGSGSGANVQQQQSQQHNSTQQPQKKKESKDSDAAASGGGGDNRRHSNDDKKKENIIKK